ncbi:uncharacterized protein LOC113851177 [Abrus precatorius]|uniref:Uncharacterized protein LOC113851177 n=1 Tax=Abrus precatorius TaxID=3816 RepID=A0A8B8K169_ABRPR|nr:uncharacterized protein LOC113851177 [Abrus precatorius]
MEPKVEQKPPKIKVIDNIPELDLATLKKNSHMLVSPTSQSTISRKNSNGRLNCLCSPTTHAGSFRCRHHRSSGLTRGRSVGSNLLELGSKTGPISDSLQAQ